jgi:hypothetical protein
MLPAEVSSVAEEWSNGIESEKGFWKSGQPINTIFNGASVERISYNVLQYSNTPILHCSM